MSERRYESLAPSTCKPERLCHNYIAARKHDGEVVLFVGRGSYLRAANRRDSHGEGSALRLSRSRYPEPLRWPAAARMRVADADDIPIKRLLLVVAALLRDGVGEVEVEREGSVTIYSKE